MFGLLDLFQFPPRPAPPGSPSPNGPEWDPGYGTPYENGGDNVWAPGYGTGQSQGDDNPFEVDDGTPASDDPGNPWQPGYDDGWFV